MEKNIGFPNHRGLGRLRLSLAATLCLAIPGGTSRSGESDRTLAAGEPPRVAAAPRETIDSSTRELSRATLAHEPMNAQVDTITRAKQAIADCQDRFRSVKDYTCTFHKQERIDGRLVKPHIMQMKARAEPMSFYFKFDQPNAGREAIYVRGKNRGRVYAHDVGIGRMLAGTMNLDPLGSMAMEENRHPITEAGIGALIETIRDRWAIELHPDESKVVFHPTATVDHRRCTLIETVHPSRQPEFMFHKVRLFVDQEFGLPIRFEAYDWPKKAGQDPELVEQYTYLKLRVNVGLTDRDFDPNNSLYSFGRF